MTARAGLVLALVAAGLAACRPVVIGRAPAGSAPPGAAAGAAATADLTLLPPLGPPAQQFVIPAVIERTLPNGLSVLVAEVHTLPLVNFHLVVPGGAAFDPVDQVGVATLTATMMRKGTARRSAEDLAREIEFLGGDVSSLAGTDFASVSGEFLSKDLVRGFDLFADVVLHPSFPEDEFRRAQGLQLAGIIEAREDPGSVAGRCYEAYLYGDHPYGRPGSGTEASVRMLAREEVQAFYARHYGPAQSVLVLIGDAPAAELAAKAEEAFGGWRSHEGGQPLLPLPTRVSGRHILLVDKPDATQAHLRVGNIAIARTDPDYVPAVITSTILGGGFGSRLVDELRVKRSLTYGAWSSFMAYRMPGDFRVGTFTKVGTAGEALKVTLDVMRAFADGGATAEELARAQSLQTGQYPAQFETPGALAGQLGALQVYGLPRSEIETFPKKVTAVTAADVRRIAATYISTDDAAIVVVGPASVVEPQLAGFGPIDHTTPETCDLPGGPSALR
jgi:zinc protease